jgi:phosphatidylinositol glycan class A protein
MVCDFFYPRLGGVENHIWSLSQHLLRQGHKVVVITHAYGNRKGVRYMSEDLKVYYCPLVPMVDSDCCPTFTSSLPLLRWIFVREGIEIVHAHQATSTLANESIVYASMLGLASVYTDHSLFGFDDLASVILNRVLQTTLSTVGAAVCVSHTCRDNLILRAHLDPSRARVIPNAVDPSRFTPDPSQRSSNRYVVIVVQFVFSFPMALFCVFSHTSHTTKTNYWCRIKVVVVSRLVYRKGVDLLVGIVPAICRKLENVDFIIGGDGSKMLDVQEMVERERLQDRVELLGSVPHVQVRNVLVRGHVFLNCSLTESFCIAILEAASCGLLVVSTNVGGVPEVLPHDMIHLAEPSVPDMVDQLQRAIAKQDSDQVADPWKTHERIVTMYSWQRVATETTCVYDTVLKQGVLRSFGGRLAMYQSLGGFSGLVACLIMVTLELWLRVVEWWQPRADIDVVPDLPGTRSRLLESE